MFLTRSYWVGDDQFCDYLWFEFGDEVCQHGVGE